MSTFKESFPLATQMYQKDAPGMYGTHFIENQPFHEYHSAYKYFFDSLPKNMDSINLLDIASGNENRVLDGMRQFNRRVNLTATDIETPFELGALPENVLRKFVKSDVRQNWPFPNNYFDGAIYSWALHWMGLEGARTSLDNLSRVLKPGSDAIISTLTPFDGLIRNSVFERTKISKKALYKQYPNSVVIGKHRKEVPVWSVDNDVNIREQLKTGQGYVIKRSHPLSVIGEKNLIGFSPHFLKAEFQKRNFEIIMEVVKPNKGFPNQYPATLQEGRTHLIYVVRKGV